MKEILAEVLDLLRITSNDLEHKTRGPDIIRAYLELSIETSQTDGYHFLLLIYTQSSFRDFESYLRTLTGFEEDDIQLILKQNNSKLTTYKISPDIYTFKDISEVLSRGFEKKLKPEEKYNQIQNMINPIQLSSNVIAIPWKLNWL